MKIDVINISRDGVESAPLKMELEHYLKAKKVQPDRWKTANDNSEKIVARIPMDAVPIGTTMEDVAKFEAERGKLTAKGKSRFEMLLKAAETGTDISEADEELLNQSANLKTLISEEAPEGYISPVVETYPGELDPGKVIADMQPKTPKEKQPKYDKEELMKLTIDKIQAIAETEISDEKTLKLVLKAKKKEDLVNSIIQLTKK